MLCALLFATRLQAVSIIPQPASVKELPGSFTLDKSTTFVNGSNSTAIRVLSEILKTDYQLQPANGKSAGSQIQLVIDKNLRGKLGAEGYRLQVSTGKVVITAPEQTGLFYGIQSLRQLIRTEGDHYSIPCVEIADQPRFAWRAFMLDEGRYFKGKDVVKQLLDEMALLKMNIFHWHLTDDQGWRIEIKKYPLLTTVGSKRDSTQIGGWNSPKSDGKPHAGFYTQEDIKEIIRYAADRHITVVPEIEMPGHSSAAIAAYPWLGVKHQPIPVPGKFGVHYDVFNVADPKVIAFLQDVLTEVTALFPSKVIHIGGDEVKYNQWKEDAGVNAYMKAKGIRSAADLQIAFTNGISNYLAGKNRRMMGWNEIMGAKLHEFTDDKDVTAGEPLAKGTIVHFWKGEVKLITDAVSKGYDVVNSYHVFTYLDYDYEEISLEKAYSFDPVPAGLATQYHRQILGSGCQMWSEWIPTTESMERQVFPRLAAYAEDGWTPAAQKNFNAFKESLSFFHNRWKQAGIEWHQ